MLVGKNVVEVAGNISVGVLVNVGSPGGGGEMDDAAGEGGAPTGGPFSISSSSFFM
jgi:hypothetical protein